MFAAEIGPELRLPVAHVGDRVLVTGLLQPRGRVLLQTMEVLPSTPADDTVVGMLLSVSLAQRRLVLRSDAGRRLRVAYGPDTTFVRLGRKSSAEELKFGDRVWVGRKGGEAALRPASRIEVMGASGGRFAGTGMISAIDSDRQQLRVRFGHRGRTVLADRAAVRGSGGSGAVTTLRVGATVRVSGVERHGVIVARRVEPLPSAGVSRVLTGRVQAVDPATRVLRVADESLNSQRRRVRVPAGTRVMADGRSLDLRALRVGSRVRVEGENDARGVLVAHRVTWLP
jgi:hypothetical protein